MRYLALVALFSGGVALADPNPVDEAFKRRFEGTADEPGLKKLWMGFQGSPSEEKTNWDYKGGVERGHVDVKRAAGFNLRRAISVDAVHGKTRVQLRQEYPSQSKRGAGADRSHYTRLLDRHVSDTVSIAATDKEGFSGKKGPGYYAKRTTVIQLEPGTEVRATQDEYRALAKQGIDFQKVTGLKRVARRDSDGPRSLNHYLVTPQGDYPISSQLYRANRALARGR